MDMGIDSFRRETLGASLEVAQLVLESLDLPRKQAAHLVKTFRDHDVQRLHDAHREHDDEARMRYLAVQSANELEALFEEDEADRQLHE
jgi:glutathione-regulated potassium-efflux system protein KefB